MDSAHGQVKCRARVFPRGFWGKCPSKHGHYTNAFRYSESLGLPSMPSRVSLLTYLSPRHCRRIYTESSIHGDFPGERPLATSLLPLPTVVSPRRLFRSFHSLNGWKSLVKLSAVEEQLTAGRFPRSKSSRSSEIWQRRMRITVNERNRATRRLAMVNSLTRRR
jgi:hypothetical protein